MQHMAPKHIGRQCRRQIKRSGNARSSGARSWDALLKLDPRNMMGNPVMFVVEIGSVITTVLLFQRRTRRSSSTCRSRCGCGSRCCSPTSPKPWPKAAARRRPTRCARRARRPWRIACCRTAARKQVPSSKLRAGDMVLVAAGEFIPGDGEIIEGVASVDESAITGESAPVIREAGGDRSAVTGGTRVLSDQIKVKITSNPGETFLDRMIALVEGAERQKTPNEIALNILLAGLDHHLPAGSCHACSRSPFIRARRRPSSCWSRCWCA